MKRVGKIKTGDKILLNVGSLCTRGVVKKERKEKNKTVMIVELEVAVCADVGGKCAISKKVGERWRLVGVGKITENSQKMEIVSTEQP